MARPRKTDRHLPQCVYFRSGAYFYVKGGKWIRLAKDLPEALKAYGSLITEPSSGMTALIDKVVAGMKGKVSDSTHSQYCTAARQLKSRLIEFAPDQVKPRHVAAIKMDMASTPNMANRCLSLLRQIFAQAVEWQIVDSNPCIGIKPHEEGKRGRYITDAEYEAIYVQAGARLQVIMDLLYQTGQRVRDVLGIRYADIGEDGITFRPQKTQRKTGNAMVVRWTPELRAIVDRAKTLHGNVRALTLLHNRRGKVPDYKTVSVQWVKACEKAGVQDAQMRDLRAKSLTDAHRQGHNATALAGHTSALMTTRYIRRRQTPVVDGPRVLDSSKTVLDE